MGLFLLYVAAPADLAEGEAPTWVADWLAGRRARPEKQGGVAEPTGSPTEQQLAEQRKRAERRERRVDAGVAELDRWLRDQVRQGFAGLPSGSRVGFEQMAKRLVDAQAPGLARLVREMALLPDTGQGWPERLALALGRLYLLLEAWRRQSGLSPELRADVRSLVGFNTSREEVLAGAGVRDTWAVLSRRDVSGPADLVRTQRTWLWGERSQRWAMLLDFSARGQPFELALAPGTRVEAEVCFYPGAVKMRGLLRGEARVAGPVEHVPGASIQQALGRFAGALADNPWLPVLPIALAAVTPCEMAKPGLSVADGEGDRVRVEGVSRWALLALSGGRPLRLVGEWDGFDFTPLAALDSDGQFAHLPESPP